jgi:cyclopropane fatty-acyl-phospholipid synthase-like methyltransferase
MISFSEACERNKAPILSVLNSAFAERTAVLEIGSGTGQHAVHFAANLRHLIWQPTEQAPYLADLAERIEKEGTDNLRPPALLDVNQARWPVREVDAIFTANTLHIMSWPDVLAMFRGVDAVLRLGGAMCIYGPFRYGGRYTSDSNRGFDAMLQARDANSGMRDIHDVTAAAAQYGLRLQADHDLPANNRLLELVRDASVQPA